MLVMIKTMVKVRVIKPFADSEITVTVMELITKLQQAVAFCLHF